MGNTNQAVALEDELAPVPVPTTGLVAAYEIRCSVCERPLWRSLRDGKSRAIMIKCRHCGALQHRHL